VSRYFPSIAQHPLHSFIALEIAQGMPAEPEIFNLEGLDISIPQFRMTKEKKRYYVHYRGIGYIAKQNATPSSLVSVIGHP
jgi:hypothetical protein